MFFKCKVSEWPQEKPKVTKQDADGLPHRNDAMTSAPNIANSELHC